MVKFLRIWLLPYLCRPLNLVVESMPTAFSQLNLWKFVWKTRLNENFKFKTFLKTVYCTERNYSSFMRFWKWNDDLELHPSSQGLTSFNCVKFTRQIVKTFKIRKDRGKIFTNIFWKYASKCVICFIIFFGPHLQFFIQFNKMQKIRFNYSTLMQ